MLDDNNVIRQRDPSGALTIAASQFEQAKFPVKVQNPEHDGRAITKVVVLGMGGSALAALVAKTWLSGEMAVPFEVIRDYTLPQYVDFGTLVIASSYSGNTEETLAGLEQARQKNAQIAIIAAGGKLIDIAKERNIAHVVLPLGMQPRMALVCGLRALVALFGHFNIVSNDRFAEIAEVSDWLGEQTKLWTSDVTTDKNVAKQLALLSIGKTPVFYGGPLMSPVAYKWKISWNENAKNIAFWDAYPEFNHNEFMGWVSHPIEKPFAVFDLVSKFENPRILKRIALSDRLLSGRRPKAHTIDIEGDSIIAQLLWGCILADFASVYVAILNGVDPTPVALIEKLKTELAH